MKLKDKTAIVTGAASGIGKEIATVFAREGAKVAIADLALAAAGATVEELRRSGGVAMAVEMDVTDESQVNEGVAAVVEAWGGVDILVSNAGIQIVHPLEEFQPGGMAPDAGDPSRRRLPHHPRLPAAYVQGRRRQHHLYGLGPFQGGLEAEGPLCHRQARADRVWPRWWRRKGPQHGVRANVICPGFVRTPLVDKQIPEQAKHLGISEEEVIKKIMLKDTVDGEFTTLQDVAEVALFFASFPSNALTGQSLVVSHGWFMQ